VTRPFAVSVVGRDRPGIVAALAEVLLRHGVNIEDSRMTILRGHLAMTLVVATPEEADAGRVGDELQAVRERLGLESVSLAEVEALEPDPDAGPSHIVSIYGVDHPGIVHAVSSALAERGWNITDLETRLTSGGEAGPLYAMVMEVALTGGASTEQLEHALAPVAAAERVEVTCRPLEREAL
jgi:glycine cleavage system transcriptional repressor